MEPPAKRPRTGPSPVGQQRKGGDDDDELNYEPEEVSQMRDPGYQLEQSRAFAAFKLKSTFEHIFQKYERDFTGIGDEIDLRTGKIITNNGHLENMRNERDTGVQDGEEEEEDEGVLLEDAFSSDDDDEGEKSDAGHATGNEEPAHSDGEEDEEIILHGRREAAPAPVALVARASTGIQRRSNLPQSPPSASRLVSEQRLSSFALPGPPRNGHTNSSVSIWGAEPETLDPAWKAPEIHQPESGASLMSRLYGTRYRFPVSRGSQSVWSSRPDSELDKVAAEPARIDMAMLAGARYESLKAARPAPTKKLLQAFTNLEDDKEDDILGVSITERTSRVQRRKDATEGEKSRVDNLNANAAQEQQEDHVQVQEGDQVQTSSSNTSLLNKHAGFNVKPAREERQRREQFMETTVRKRRKNEPIGTLCEPAQLQPDDISEETDSPNTPILVTEDEAREALKYQLVIELFSKVPQQGEITEFKDPDDIDTYTPAERFGPQTQEDIDASLSMEPPSNPEPQTVQETVTSSLDDATEADTSPNTEEQSKKPPAPPKEKFARHEIDPCYAFSDDEDGIPTARMRSRRRGNKSLAYVPEDTVASAQPVSEILGNTLDCSRSGEDKQQAEGSLQSAQWENVGEATEAQPDAMEIDPHEGERAYEPMETNRKPLGSPTHHSPEDSVEAPLTDVQSTEGPIENVTVQEPDVATEAHVATTEDATSPSPLSAIVSEGSQPSTDQLEEQDQGFTITLGLDESDGASATDPEAMNVDLPTLPPSKEEQQAEAEAINTSPHPRRCGRGSAKASSSSSSRWAQNDVTSPMRRLNLQPSSPLKRLGTTVASVRPRRSVRFDKPADNESKSKSTTNTNITQPATLPEPPSPFAQNQPDTAQISVSPNPPPPSSPRPSPARQLSHTPKATPQPKTPSTTRRSFVSLLSDDEDEPTLDLFKTWTTITGSGASTTEVCKKTKTSYSPVLLAGPQTKIITPMNKHHHQQQQQQQQQQTHCDTGSGSGIRTGAGTKKRKKRQAAWAFASPTPTKVVHLGSPSGLLIRTPGGHMRRCGEDGFRCDRDFCFTCL